jgi:hypothetical protein
MEPISALGKLFLRGGSEHKEGDCAISSRRN